jgi:hypothetical protein
MTLKALFLQHPSLNLFPNGLVNHRSGKQCVAVGFQRDGQSFKPVSPFSIDMPLNPELIDMATRFRQLSSLVGYFNLILDDYQHIQSEDIHVALITVLLRGLK